ncbi:hypothetical protein [Streptomyces narbonensis]|uniref:hypothetical protein n=1 Tax=Streptomyces narbonensis TaxID=67333 RepID=UPI0033D1E6AF
MKLIVREEDGTSFVFDGLDMIGFIAPEGESLVAYFEPEGDSASRPVTAGEFEECLSAIAKAAGHNEYTYEIEEGGA